MLHRRVFHLLRPRIKPASSHSPLAILLQSRRPFKMLRFTNQPEPDPKAVQLLRDNLTSIPSVNDSPSAVAELLATTFAPAPTKILLLGDSTHGTSEFYTARAELTKHLITHHGFNIVAVEADWPDAEAVDRYVRHRPGPGPRVTSPGKNGAGEEEEDEANVKKREEAAFRRFPTWMWRNVEVQRFVEWLRTYNKGKDVKKEAVGFYGLDLYSLGTSMNAVVEYLDKVDPKMAELARRRYEKLMVWAEDPHEYGLEMLATGFKGYEREVVAMLRDLLAKRLEYSAKWWDGEDFHGSEQNARLVKGEFSSCEEALTPGGADIDNS